MIISRIYGGLGNQLFQYSLARRLSIISNQQIFFDISELSSELMVLEGFREFQINLLKIRGDIISRRLTSLLIPYRSRIIRPFLKYSPLKLIRENKPYLYDKKVLTIADSGKSLYVDGYWQSYKYFQSIRDILINDLEPKNVTSLFLSWLQKINSVNSVALHVRRGDYLSNHNANMYHGICSFEYYFTAIDCFKSKLGNPIFFIFSDDINLCKKVFVGPEYVFVSSDYLTAVEDLFLIASCGHQIIANSSFSWWGAWLNKNPNKLVLYPDKWISAYDILTCDLIPEDWVCVSNNR